MFAIETQELNLILGELHKLCLERKVKLATAESCTGGLISSLITAMSGSSNYFQGGVCSYSNEAKHKILGVPWELIEAHGAVSSEVAKAMAIGVRNSFNADYSVSVTGIAGPGGGTPIKPVGTVYLGFSSEGAIDFELLQLKGDRNSIRTQTCLFALAGLHKRIFSLSGVSK